MGAGYKVQGARSQGYRETGLQRKNDTRMKDSISEI